MKYRMISSCAEGAGILYKLMQEGNKVELYIDNEMYKNAWNGILPKVDKMDSNIDSNTFVIFDTVGFGKFADSLINSGITVFGASTFADKLESDRKFGTQFMESWDIKTPYTETFKSIKDAIKFIDDSNIDRYVFKPHGDHDTISTSLTYVSEDKDDIISYLEFVGRHVKEIKEFDIQEFIEGTAISTEVFVLNGESLGIYNHTIENKKFLNNDLGPSTGCSGNIVWFSDMDKVISEGIGKVKEFGDYTGFIDLNSIISEDGLYGLEWTPRFGYDASPTLLYSLLECNVGDFLDSFINGNLDDSLFLNDIAGSVRLSIPPYPLEGKSPDYDNTGVPIKADLDDFYFYEVMKDGDDLVHSGGIGLILLSIESDFTEDSIEECISKLDDLKIPDKQYRTDLSDSLYKSFDEFSDWSIDYAGIDRE